MGRRKKPVTYPKAVACGMLEDRGRVLFLEHERGGKKRLALPFVKIQGGDDPVSEINREFEEQTGIDGEIHEAIFEGKYNAGSRKYKKWVPLLVFKVTAKKMKCRPAEKFSGFRWIDLKKARTLEKKKELFFERWISALLGKMIA
ncbi:NUDIX domain-containing protein [Candidatus Micrarchaeota archaeon]|nr:NUDIX domain-containing protein [Candidatus Micrarchaeota archaeon]